MTLTEALSRIAELERENEQLKKQLQKKNQRNAGRKKADEKWVKGYSTFCKLQDSGATKAAIQQEMKISDATFYRYQKLKRDTSISLREI